ncbi:hypothetical protein BGZ63DRAFT_392295 [Mariannaea sp. PMI_226]|nr:hypothetical protein BGZ63DRAFT_392295 [Mariannaea sp. PMI_226]
MSRAAKFTQNRHHVGFLVYTSLVHLSVSGLVSFDCSPIVRQAVLTQTIYLPIPITLVSREARRETHPDYQCKAGSRLMPSCVLKQNLRINRVVHGVNTPSLALYSERDVGVRNMSSL